MKRIISTFFLTFALILCAFPLTALALPEGVPAHLPAPTIANLQLMENKDGVPYFRVEATFPQSVLDLDAEQPADGWVNLETDGKIDNLEWGSTGGGGGHLELFLDYPVPGKSNTYYVEFELKNEGDLTETVINSRTYSFRLQFYYTYYNKDGSSEDIYSPWSNVLSSKSQSYYKGASSWAEAELQKALEYGFITERIRDNMAGKVTREEFAEIAVKLYEKNTGKTASAGSVRFADTTNPEILKAANLGLVEGVGNNKYAPDQLVTREQMATILFRALKVIKPDADFSAGNVATFADDDKVESWARDGVYYCFKTSIMTGVGSNTFNPDGNATREQAVLVCTRTYEFFRQ